MSDNEKLKTLIGRLKEFDINVSYCNKEGCDGWIIDIDYSFAYIHSNCPECGKGICSKCGDLIEVDPENGNWSECVCSEKCKINYNLSH